MNTEELSLKTAMAGHSYYRLKNLSLAIQSMISRYPFLVFMSSVKSENRKRIKKNKKTKFTLEVKTTQCEKTNKTIL